MLGSSHVHGVGFAVSHLMAKANRHTIESIVVGPFPVGEVEISMCARQGPGRRQEESERGAIVGHCCLQWVWWYWWLVVAPPYMKNVTRRLAGTRGVTPRPRVLLPWSSDTREPGDNPPCSFHVTYILARSVCVPSSYWMTFRPCLPRTHTHCPS